MPDGDVVHNKLRRLYQEPYKWLCEGKATSDECARILLEKLRSDIKNKGILPIILAQSMADILTQAMNTNNGLEEKDYAALSMDFERIVQQSDGQLVIKDLSLLAGKRLLHDLRYGQVRSGNFSAMILERYINEVYESSFKECVPLTFKHHAGIDQLTLSKRIDAIQPSMQAGISKFARDAIRNRSFINLSLPKRSARIEIDLDEDLLAG